MKPRSIARSIRRPLGVLFLVLALGACDEEGRSATPAEDTSSPLEDTRAVEDSRAPEDTAEPYVEGCGSAAGAFVEGLTELAADDGAPAATVYDQSWSIESNNETIEIQAQTLNQATRFELEHPARIHGFKIMWSLPEGTAGATELTAGLYPDFGYNGFDFWPQPLWSGSRCAQDAPTGEWTTYALDAPITVDHPGLIYVAHQTEPGDPEWFFDASPSNEGDCAPFDACTSSLNMPQVQSDFFYNGLTLSIPNDYMVRLLVEYTDDVTPEETQFQVAIDSMITDSNHASWGDLDNDGFDDVLLSGPRLYRNNGAGAFDDVTASSGLDGLSATGGVWGDYDNDGCLDLFLYAESHTQADTLLRSNCDGTFSDVTSAAGIIDEQSYNSCGDPNNIHAPTAAAAWVDIDSDGLIDLYLANFNCWADYSFYTDTIWHALPDGTFEPWGTAQGFKSLRTPSRGVAPADHDDDGDVDLFINNYVLAANLFYDNNSDATVQEDARSFGVAGRLVNNRYGHTIGAAWGDLDNDQDLDLIAANLAHPRFFDFSDKTHVYINEGAQGFNDITGDWREPSSPSGLRYQETHSVPVLADFDQDGFLDLVITAIYDGRPTDFYRGRGDGTFTLDSYHAGITTENGWGAAAADFDHDGDMDLFATRLYENRLDASGHWLQVRAVGNLSSNRAALGANVHVTAGDATYTLHVQGGTGKGGQDSLYLHFGLGERDPIDSIRVRYIGGGEVTYTGPFSADQRIWVYEDGTHTLGWSGTP